MRKKTNSLDQTTKRKRALKPKTAPKPVEVSVTPLCAQRPPITEGLFTYQSAPIRDIPPGDKVQLPVGHSILVKDPAKVVATEALAKMGWEIVKPARLHGWHTNLMVHLRNASKKSLTIEPDTHVATLVRE